MSWNILPKNVLQYFLTKLKGLMYTKTEVDNLIPDSLSDLSDDATHRLVTDTEKTAWNGKSVVSANPQSTTGTLSGLEIDGIGYDIPSGGGNVQSDWNETDSTADDYIKNKPILWDMNHDGPYIGAAIVGQFDPQTLQPIWQATQFFPRIETHEVNPNYEVGSTDHNKVCWTEYKPGSAYSLPTNHYYNIVTMVGDSSDRVSQIAMCSQDNSVYYRVRNTGTWTNWVSLKNVQADWNATSGEAVILNKPTIPDISTKVTKAGDTMSGTLYFSNYNDVAICLDSSGPNYKTTVSHQNAGQEATVFATKLDATSLIFINGEDSLTNHARDRWQSLVPGLQIKKNCVAIGKLIGQGVDPSYKLEVDGKSRLYGGTTIDGGGLIVQGRAYGSGDDEGLVVLPASNGIAGVVLGANTGRRTQLYLRSSGLPEWVYNNGSTSYIVYHPGKEGTMALTSDLPGNDKVTQTNTTGSYNFRMLFSGTDDNTDRTEGARKSVNFLFNPASNIFYIGGSVNASRWWYAGSQALKIGASNEGDYFIFLGVAGGSWYFGPDKDNKLYCGHASWRWRTVYAVNGSINTSDRNQKRDIKELDAFAKDFIMDLKPVSFKRIDGDRTHYGMVAQDVEETMNKFGLSDMDFAGFCKDQKVEKYEEEIVKTREVEKEDGTIEIIEEKSTEEKERLIEGEYIYGLRYEEFIAPMIKTIQIQQQEIEELKRRIEILEGK